MRVKKDFLFIFIGGSCILGALIANPFFIAKYVLHDHTFESIILPIRIILCEITLLFIGGWCIYFRHELAEGRRQLFWNMFGIAVILNGFLFHEWSLSKLFGWYGQHIYVLTWLLDAILILTGLLIWRYHYRIPVSLTIRMKRYGLRLLWAGMVILCFEGVFYWTFFYVLPPNLRNSAYFTAVGTPLSELDAPDIRPYLWSNYAPNPLSPKVNEFGWRYGGEPKKKGFFRILCLGGSTTWSIFASSPEKSYPAQLERYLQQQGYRVDVVNGGVSYHSSAELIGTLAFRGLYTEPDLVLIHTGGNDTGPFMSPRPYQPDYSHWRTVSENIDTISRNDKFRIFWQVPSWTMRVFLTFYFRPDAFSHAMLAKQLTTAQEELLATNDITTRQPTGLENNIRTLIGISRAHHAKAAVILYNLQPERLHVLVPSLQHDQQQYEQVRHRAQFAIERSNVTMRQVAEEMNVPIIPFNTFAPSYPGFWKDHCHLTDQGAYEKAIFIGKWLIEHNLLR